MWDEDAHPVVITVLLPGTRAGRRGRPALARAATGAQYPSRRQRTPGQEQP
jgi:hypothetical protein